MAVIKAGVGAHACEKTKLGISGTFRRRRRRATQAVRHFIIERSPPWLRRSIGPFAAYIDMLFVDHGIFRIAYLNKHRLGDNAWRSAQPAPHQIRTLARQGVRTIVNLRGERQCGSYWLEHAACRRHEIALVSLKLRSRTPPTREDVEAARVLFEDVEYPILIHCKSGADRAGLASVLYRHLRDGVPIEVAANELSLRFGHFRHASTGVLDCFFERYVAYRSLHPVSFLEWVREVYDPSDVREAFGTARWTRRALDSALGRE